MEGTIEVSYTVMCKHDVRIEITLNDLLTNEKVLRAIKGEFAKGLRNIEVTAKENTPVTLKTAKEIYTFTASKNDFADLLELAEEDARSHKRLKKECEGVELVDIQTSD
ncbi:hypothetical protein MNB_SV-4-211 [hydrothermal vent metagenome]|uniref:Uncharacterized protein n=1 Tax=hydrothermal vent metagenome TaxID=652676 RepID=A0A1W1E723_9ZZZZ